MRFSLFVSFSLACIMSIFAFVFNPAVWLYLFDLITLKQVIVRKVELRLIRGQITVAAYRDKGSINYLSYFFDGSPIFCCFFYFPLKSDHVPKSSPKKASPNFYRYKTNFLGHEKDYFRFIMTKKKSMQIDALFQKEPTAEFEICYYRFSRIVKEIRPIEGYDYADGVDEICSRINQMYP